MKLEEIDTNNLIQISSILNMFKDNDSIKQCKKQIENTIRNRSKAMNNMKKAKVISMAAYKEAKLKQ